MTHQEKLSFVISKIHEAVPDVKRVQIGTRLKHREGWETVAISELDEYDGVSHKNGYGPIISFKNLGRKIGIADVLLTLSMFVKPNPEIEMFSIQLSIAKKGTNGRENTLWDLKNDDITKQSEKTIEFIYNLLK